MPHAALCMYYNIIDDLLLHAPLPLCSYWGYGQEFYIILQGVSLLRSLTPIPCIRSAGGLPADDLYPVRMRVEHVHILADLWQSAS
jgi:hypothetical protein